MKYTSNRNNWEVVLHDEPAKDGFYLVRASNTERFSLVHCNKEFYRIFKDGNPFFDDYLFLFEPYTIRKAENELNENRFVFLLAAANKSCYCKNDIFPAVCVVDTLCGKVACLFNDEEYDANDYVIFENVLYVRSDKVAVYLPSMEVVYNFNSTFTSVVANEEESFVVKDVNYTREGNSSNEHTVLVEINKKTGNAKVIYG